MLRNKACALFCIISLALCVPSYAQEQFVYDAAGKRDPFIPLVTPDGRLLDLDMEKVKGALNVEGIIYDKNGVSYAIINGAVMTIGDSVDGSRLLKIEEDKVILIKDGDQFQLELKEDER